MKVKKIIIISMIIVLIIIIAVLCLIIGIQKNNNNNNVIDYGTVDTYTNTPVVENVKDKMKFFTVSDCVSQYIDELNTNNTKYYGIDDEGNYTKVVNEQYIKQKIYNMLSKEYIEENNINLNNLYNFIEPVEEQLVFIPIKMKVLSIGDIEKYVVYGLIGNVSNTASLKELYIGVNLDLNTRTFAIEPIKSSNVDEIEIKTSKINKIEEEENNTFNYINVNDEYAVKQYLDFYKRIALTNPEIAYEFLDNEYREKRFGSLENYKKYVKQSQETIESATIAKYQVTNVDNYTQYTCLLENGNYYIFRETSVMQYTVNLDTYTIDLPEYIQKYNNATDQQKVALNINKFIQAINNSDYRYAYNCLADSYKNNYFKKQEEFETYAKENFYKSSNVGYVEFGTQGGVYTYKVVLTDKESGDKKNKTFIMQLGEGTNFVLSFDR